MLNGQLYYAFGPELTNERLHAKNLLHQFNHLAPDQVSQKNELLNKLLGSLKDIPIIEAPFQCDYGYNIHIGCNFFANYNLVILDCAKVTIGDNVLIGPNVGIYTGGHPVEHKIRNEGLEFAHPISIGNNVWIGGNVCINPGVTIGDNTIIGSGSVVTKSMPSNVIAFGNPCKVSKRLQE